MNANFADRCICSKLLIPPALKAEVFEAEAQLLRSLPPDVLDRYKTVTLAFKHTWGLCPSCDRKLFALVSAYDRRTVTTTT